jgi:hypothetical protein
MYAFGHKSFSDLQQGYVIVNMLKTCLTISYYQQHMVSTTTLCDNVNCRLYYWRKGCWTCDATHHFSRVKNAHEHDANKDTNGLIDSTCQLYVGNNLSVSRKSAFQTLTRLVFGEKAKHMLVICRYC